MVAIQREHAGGDQHFFRHLPHPDPKILGPSAE
jgi:hypothetical protein